MVYTQKSSKKPSYVFPNLFVQLTYCNDTGCMVERLCDIDINERAKRVHVHGFRDSRLALEPGTHSANTNLLRGPWGSTSRHLGVLWIQSGPSNIEWPEVVSNGPAPLTTQYLMTSAKMVPSSPQPPPQCTGSSGNPGPASSSTKLLGTQSPVSTPALTHESPASTESLIEKTLDDLLPSQPIQSPASPPTSGTIPGSPSLEDTDHQTVKFTKFSELLEQGLAKTVQQITMKIKADL